MTGGQEGDSDEPERSLLCQEGSGTLSGIQGLPMPLVRLWRASHTDPAGFCVFLVASPCLNPPKVWALL